MSLIDLTIWGRYAVSYGHLGIYIGDRDKGVFYHSMTIPIRINKFHLSEVLVSKILILQGEGVRLGILELPSCFLRNLAPSDHVLS